MKPLTGAAGFESTISSGLEPGAVAVVLRQAGSFESMSSKEERLEAYDPPFAQGPELRDPLVDWHTALCAAASQPKHDENSLAQVNELLGLIPDLAKDLSAFRDTGEEAICPMKDLCVRKRGILAHLDIGISARERSLRVSVVPCLER